MGKLSFTHLIGGQMNLGMFLLFSDYEGPLQGPEGSQLFLMDYLVCLEKSSQNILLWDDYTMGKLRVAYMEGGQRNN